MEGIVGVGLNSRDCGRCCYYCRRPCSCRSPQPFLLVESHRLLPRQWAKNAEGNTFQAAQQACQEDCAAFGTLRTPCLCHLPNDPGLRLGKRLTGVVLKIHTAKAQCSFHLPTPRFVQRRAVWAWKLFCCFGQRASTCPPVSDFPGLPRIPCFSGSFIHTCLRPSASNLTGIQNCTRSVLTLSSLSKCQETTAAATSATLRHFPMSHSECAVVCEPFLAFPSLTSSSFFLKFLSRCSVLSGVWCSCLCCWCRCRGCAQRAEEGTVTPQPMAARQTQPRRDYARRGSPSRGFHRLLGKTDF